MKYFKLKSDQVDHEWQVYLPSYSSVLHFSRFDGRAAHNSYFLYPFSRFITSYDTLLYYNHTEKFIKDVI